MGSRLQSFRGDKRRAREGQNKRGQKTTAGREENKRRTRGWPARPKDNSRTRGEQEEDTGLASAARGQEEDKTRTQSPDKEFRGPASQCGQLFFPRENPDSKLLGGKDVVLRLGSSCWHTSEVKV